MLIYTFIVMSKAIFMDIYELIVMTKVSHASHMLFIHFAMVEWEH